MAPFESEQAFAKPTQANASGTFRLVLDDEVFRWNPNRGIPRLYREILQRLPRVAPDIELVICLQGSGSVHLPAIEGVTRVEIPSLPPGLRPWRFWSSVAPRVNALLRSIYWRRMAEKTDVYHATHYRLTRSWSPSFSLVHDMIPELFPDAFPGAEAGRIAVLKRKAVKRALLVLCDSKNTRGDLVRMLGVPEKKCRVLFAAGFPPERVAAYERVQQPPLKPFLLYVGGYRTRYKNFGFILDALSSSDVATLSRYSLVVAGPEMPSAAEEAELRHRSAVEIRFMNNPDDGQLIGLYLTCAAFVMPSLYEGFGLPVLEALACGAPVICSRVASLPEVGGDAVYYFDPRSPQQFCEALSKALADGRSPELVARRKERAMRFSWEKTAEGFAAAVREVARIGNRLRSSAARG
ncbi:MAG: glycosyltransferase family 4 protein [Kiritimatiellia bacterium]